MIFKPLGWATTWYCVHLSVRLAWKEMGSGLFKDDQWDTVTGRLTTPQHAVYIFILFSFFSSGLDGPLVSA